MKKAFFSTFLFILFLLTLGVIYLSFFGYETNKFNKIIKSEIKKTNKNISLDFKKISVLLDIKEFILFVRFINPNINYNTIPIPLKSLRTNIDLEFLTKKKIAVKKVILSTEYLEFNKIKPLLKIANFNLDNLKSIKKGKFQIKDLELEFDENFKLKTDFTVKGDINQTNIKISDKFEVTNLFSNFLYKNNYFHLNEMSWDLNKNEISKKEFFNGELKFKKIKKKFEVNLKFKTTAGTSLPKIPIINYSLSKNNILEVKSKFLIDNNKSIFFEKIEIEDNDNEFKISNLHLNKDYNLIRFNEIKVKTFLDNKINNEFKIKNKNNISIKGNVFDAKILIKELSKDRDGNKFLKRISKDIEIDFNNILKGAQFPIKNFRLVGKINKGSFDKISAKSDFTDNKHLDISLKKQKETNEKILEVYSDIANPLLSDYKFFQGLEGGDLNYVSRFDKNNSNSILTINNFKLNKAPALAKILSLADLKGLTDTLKGEGISFDTLSIKYVSNQKQMNINEIFMIGPSISILIDGYVEKQNGLVSLRGTLVPAKTLNIIISKIPVVGDILIGKKVGEGIFGISFKIKGPPNNLKTTVNPIKTLTPRFITRALESVKKK